MVFGMLWKITTRFTSPGDIAGAFAALETDPADVLVTDLRLGAEDGMDLMEKALKLPKPPICIIDDGLWFCGYRC